MEVSRVVPYALPRASAIGDPTLAPSVPRKSGAGSERTKVAVPVLIGGTLAGGIFFFALHALVRTGSRRDFKVDARLARGLGGLVLVGLGLFAVVRWWRQWSEAFLGAESAAPGARVIVGILLGHLVADLVWFVLGRVRHGAPLQADLVLHHVLGLAAVVATVVLDVGQVAVAVILLSEALPVTTGLLALGQARSDTVLQRAALRWGLGVVVAWRMPMWLGLLGILGWRLGTGLQLEPVHRVAAAALTAILVLDVVWAFGYVRLLREGRGAGAR